MRTVAIIILHYGNWADTQACLGSLKKLKKNGLEVQVIVVNNSPRRKIKDKVKQTYPSALYLKTSHNLGFAGGNNLGIKRALRAGVDYVVLLNNDTVVGPTAIKKMVATFEKRKEIGVVGPVIKHQTKRGMRFDYGGKINWLLGRTYHLNRLDHRDKQLQERDFVSGCCLMVKKDVLNKIGLLNEQYFLYLEDVEFCTRAKRRGFKVLINPQTKIFHKGSRSVSSWMNLKYNFINSLRFSWQFVPWPAKFLAVFCNLVFYVGLVGTHLLRKVLAVIK